MLSRKALLTGGNAMIDVSLKEYADMRAAELQRLGLVALGGVVSSIVVGFVLSGRAVTVALDSERRATADKAASLVREVKAHNGKIREWELKQAEKDAETATKADIKPLQKDLSDRQASAVTVGKLTQRVVIALGLGMTFGFGIAHLPGIGG
jgi:hypothetical protein